MSRVQNGATYMAPSAIRNGGSEVENFDSFFEHWLVEQNQHLQDLISASKQHKSTNTNKPFLDPLINQVIHHYEQYYRAKAKWTKQDVLAMLTPPWRSTLEEAFLWVGGWRPSMAFHLLYSKSGLQIEEQLGEMARGLGAGDLGDLSPSQMRKVDELQRKTIKEEREITEKMAKQQETVADVDMVELSHVVTELMRNNNGNGGGGLEVEQDKVESSLATKEEGLEEILKRADDLRLRTLKDILDVFTPIQAVHFLIAAAELHLRLHDWGKMKDANKHHYGTGGGIDIVTS